MGFHCTTCQQAQYRLELQNGTSAGLQVEENAFGDVIIHLPGMEPFAADTAFMNRFASCGHCGGPTQWAFSVPLYKTAGVPAKPVRSVAKGVSAPRLPQ
jgi:hypothetical protein